MASSSGPLAQHSLHLSRPFQSGSRCSYCDGSHSLFGRHCLQIGQSIYSKRSAAPCPTSSALQQLALRGSASGDEKCFAIAYECLSRNECMTMFARPTSKHNTKNASDDIQNRHRQNDSKNNDSESLFGPCWKQNPKTYPRRDAEFQCILASMFIDFSRSWEPR